MQAPADHRLNPRLSARVRADLQLLLAAAIWGSAFSAQRVAAAHLGPYLFNAARFLVGALLLLPLFWQRHGRRLRPPLARGDLPRIALAGLLLFGASALQQMGLASTTAANAGFITGLYVVLIPVLLVIFTRRAPRPLIWGSAALAGAGLYLLSTAGRFQLNPGDLLELAGAFLWALHVLWIGRLANRQAVLPLAIGQSLVCSALSLGASLLLETNSLAALGQTGWAILYTGVFSIGVAYTLQVSGQRQAPPPDAAILLSMEAPLAALFGWLLLSEALTPLQILGAALMLAAMLLAQSPALRKLKNGTQKATLQG